MGTLLHAAPCLGLVNKVYAYISRITKYSTIPAERVSAENAGIVFFDIFDNSGKVLKESRATLACLYRGLGWFLHATIHNC